MYTALILCVVLLLGIVLLSLAPHFARGVPVFMSTKHIDYLRNTKTAAPGPPVARQRRAGHRFNLMSAQVAHTSGPLSAGGLAA
jgi:hypothetical protein